MASRLYSQPFWTTSELLDPQILSPKSTVETQNFPLMSNITAMIVVLAGEGVTPCPTLG